MASEKGSLNILESTSYRVFPGSGFAGNPAGLHEVGSLPTTAAMHAHAQAQALPGADHAYYWATADEDRFEVRVFSGHGEVRVCGHALYALAQHLLSRSNLPRLRLDTASFAHEAKLEGDRLWLSLPAWTWETLDLPLLRHMLEQSGLRIVALLHYPWNVWVAISDAPESIAGFDRENFAWHRLDGLKPGALILSAGRDDSCYVFRYFSPWFGKPEDTATGSAHCYLARYWLREGDECGAAQVSPAGEASMRVRLEGDRVWLHGSAVRETPGKP